MNTAGLSLDQAPPFWSVNRFFVTAPIFGILCAIYLIFFANSDILNRYTPSTIGFVHLFVLGFFAMVIFGATMQMLPVLAGVKTPFAKTTAFVSHLFLTIGALCFAISFVHIIPALKVVALTSLTIALISYFIPMLYAILKAGYKNFVIWGMRLAIIFGFLAFLLGLHLLASYAFGKISALHLTFADIHATIAIFGFAGLLIVAVAHQVLPMFYVAPSFPQFCKKFLFVAAVSLIIYFAMKMANFIYADIFIKIVLAIVFSAFGTVALRKISQRKRKVSDAALKLWKFGLVFAPVWAVLIIMDLFVNLPNKEYLFAVVFGFGFLASIIVAMLNKITPFLVWFHLINMGKFDAPNMNELLKPEISNIILKLHIVSTILLLLGYFEVLFIKAAGISILAEFIVLEYAIVNTARFYNKLR